MMNLTDEILNKFIDGDTDPDMSKEIKEHLQNSPNDMKRYKALLAVHNELKKVKSEEVSANFTQLLMKKVQKAAKAKKEQKYFVFSLSTIFLVGCLGIIGYLFFAVMQTPLDTSEPSVITNYSEEFARIIKQIFSRDNIAIIGSVMSFIMLASGYFFFESLRHSKQK